MGHYPKVGRSFLLAALVVSSMVTFTGGQGHGQRNPRMGGKGANQAKLAQQRAAQQQRYNQQQRAAQRRAEIQPDRPKTVTDQPKTPPGQEQRNRTALDQQRPQARPAQNQPPIGQARVPDLRAQILQKIGLNPQQQDRMVKIRNSHDDEFVSNGRKIRQARQSLDQAIMNPQYNEAEVNRRIEDLAQAQADQVRLNQRMRAEIRQVLTPEQVMKFNQLQREMQQKQQEQRRIELLQQNPDKSPSGDQK